MRLAVEIITGRFFYVEIGEEATVESLKKEIASKEGFDENRLLLMRKNGCLLKNDQYSLRVYGICDGTVIYLFFKPLGESKGPKGHTSINVLDFENSVRVIVKER